MREPPILPQPRLAVSPRPPACSNQSIPVGEKPAPAPKIRRTRYSSHSPPPGKPPFGFPWAELLFPPRHRAGAASRRYLALAFHFADSGRESSVGRPSHWNNVGLIPDEVGRSASNQDRPAPVCDPDRDPCAAKILFSWESALRPALGCQASIFEWCPSALLMLHV